MAKGTIYKITNSINNKIYIGLTSRPLKIRQSEHLRSYITKDNKLYRAMRKYGIENFIFEIVEENIELDQLNDREIYYINKFDSYKNGYNSTLGGEGTLLIDIDIIEDLYLEGYKINEIKKITGYDTHSISNVLVNKGYNTKNYHKGLGRCLSFEDKQLIRNLYDQGKYMCEIEKITGHARITISQYLRSLNYDVDTGAKIHKTNDKKVIFENQVFDSMSKLAEYLIQNIKIFENKKKNTVIQGISYSVKNNKSYCGYNFYLA